ncbi:3-isopropylmalate/(R)-2-methylmalate dehydratase small subunit [Halanaerobium sp. DL-01]|uniref:LeuD/DmdB family oxidoreductase small subunit n=1 Tax=Halanaerobium sp. DL-01 TaxID=1653064 RepID=UPI000DF163EB|nr:3-isopropylmalate dehydratase small subunit [Halanaerobium sp. DL-01]RCW78130.1 3-isopropylmalate/(R)-2-methylmalate dehydratase small subunit [Halanaerobium sp. DL-01]
MILQGNAVKVGRNIDTDQIIPAQYLTLTDSKELGKHCLEGYEKDFPKLLDDETIIFAEENFGCGSSREHAPFAIKGAGVKAVVAKSFARIFFRNAINLGLTVIESPEAVNDVEKGDKIKINADKGKIYNKTKNKNYDFSPFPKIIKEILMADGVTGYFKERKS